MASVVLPASVLLKTVAEAAKRMRPGPNMIMIGQSIDEHRLQEMQKAAEFALHHEPHLVALDDQELRLIQPELTRNS